MSHPYPLPADVVLNKQYRIVRVLGSGGFGITYLAEDIRLQKSYAVKEYFPNAFAVRLADNSLNIHDGFRQSFQEGLRYFYNEARKADMLQHSNIVQIAALFEENNTAYLVMPYLHGETLRAWLERHPQPELADLQNIFLPLLDALAYMHRAEIEFYDERRKQKVSATGVLHLDIKPDNILLAQTQAGQTPMLIDFGAARHHTESHGYAYRTDSNFKPHTPHYAAIEHGTQRISPATDIYGLSACLYEAVSGRIPERATERMDKDDRLSARSDFCRRYPKAWLQVIDKGFDVMPKRRYQNIAEMREAWQTALAEQGSRSRQNTGGEQYVKQQCKVNTAPLNGVSVLLLKRVKRGQDKLLALGETIKDKDIIKYIIKYIINLVIFMIVLLASLELNWRLGWGGSLVERETFLYVSFLLTAVISCIPIPKKLVLVVGLFSIFGFWNVGTIQIILGQAVLLGKIVNIDNVKQAEEEWYRKSAERGHLRGQYELGSMYQMDGKYEQAAYWYRKSAEQGFSRAQYFLAQMYEHGKGVAKDREQAVLLYRQASEQGYQGAYEADKLEHLQAE